MLSIYSPVDIDVYIVQEVGSFRGHCRGLKVVKSYSKGHFLFTCSDTSAVACTWIV